MLYQGPTEVTFRMLHNAAEDRQVQPLGIWVASRHPCSEGKLMPRSARSGGPQPHPLALATAQPRPPPALPHAGDGRDALGRPKGAQTSCHREGSPGRPGTVNLPPVPNLAPSSLQ